MRSKAKKRTHSVDTVITYGSSVPGIAVTPSPAVTTLSAVKKQKQSKQASQEAVVLSQSTTQDDLIQSLKGEIEALKTTVKELSCQVGFLLSFVGAVDPSSSTSASTSQPIHQTFAVAGSTGPASADSDDDPDKISNMSYAAKTRQPTSSLSNGNHGASSFRDAVVTAVYVDRAESDRRAASFVISGMPTSTSSSDRNLVTELCNNEFGMLPDITYTKRLGTQIPGRIQPLLVYLKQVTQSRHIVTSARQLRQSQDEFTRNNIYINENLTKAAARAAYEIRCRRRQNANHRSSVRHQTQQSGQEPAAGPSVSSMSSSLPPHERHVMSSSDVQASDHQCARTSTLNTAVPPFIPQADMS